MEWTPIRLSDEQISELHQTLDDLMTVQHAQLDCWYWCGPRCVCWRRRPSVQAVLKRQIRKRLARPARRPRLPA